MFTLYIVQFTAQRSVQISLNNNFKRLACCSMSYHCMVLSHAADLELGRNS